MEKLIFTFSAAAFVASMAWCLGISNINSGVEAEIASTEIKRMNAPTTASAIPRNGIVEAAANETLNPDSAYLLIQDPIQDSGYVYTDVATVKAMTSGQ